MWFWGELSESDYWEIIWLKCWHDDKIASRCYADSDSRLWHTSLKIKIISEKVWKYLYWAVSIPVEWHEFLLEFFSSTRIDSQPYHIWVTSVEWDSDWYSWFCFFGASFLHNCLHTVFVHLQIWHYTQIQDLSNIYVCMSDGPYINKTHLK